MIIRVFGEDQYEIPDGSHADLNALDEHCQAAVEAGDETEFHACYDKLLALLREQGTPLADDDLRPSDLMLPPPDVSLEEVRRDFSDHGLIPD